MPATEEALDSKEILTNDGSSLESLINLRRYIHCHIEQRGELERLVADWKSIQKNFSNENKSETRRGIALWVLGQVEQAIPVLETARASKEKSFFLGVSYLETDRFQDALGHLKEAYNAETGDLQANLAYAEARIKTGDLEGAEKMLERLIKKHEQVGDVHYLKGLLLDLAGEYEAAVECYDKALVMEPGHPRALFRLAYMHDLHGEDAAAMEYYQQLRKLRPVHVNTMLNLGVLFEDRGEYERAAECYQSVLDYFPNHARARLYMQDAMSALSMYYDEDAARREAKMQAMLQQPVGEISFSPRVRNALEKLDIHTLGDLCGRTEEELLTIPNFGKTSLREVKEYLTSKGLGLASGDQPEGEVAGIGAPAATDVLSRPLDELGWSTRLEKAFDALGVTTVGDLAKRNEKELLEIKNLGPTSIEEVRTKLAALGLSMITD